RTLPERLSGAAREQRGGDARDRLLAVALGGLTAGEHREREAERMTLEPRHLREDALFRKPSGLEVHAPARPRDRRNAQALRGLDALEQPARIAVEAARYQPREREHEAGLIGTGEIGRASCRERVENSGGDGALKKKT